MSIFRMLLLSLLIIATNYSQLEHYRPQNKPIQVNNLSEEDIIRYRINSFLSAVRSENYSLLKDYVAKEILNDSLTYNSITDDKNVTNSIYLKCINTDTLIVARSNNYATVEFLVSDLHNYQGKKEILVLSKDNGRWIITGSTFLVKMLLYQQPKNKSLVSAETAIWLNSSLINKSLSNSGIIQRHAIYTDLFTINWTITKNAIHRYLFGRPSDGKIVSLDGANENDAKIFTVVSDNECSRIIFAREKGLNTWIKSYGDNTGDYELVYPDCLSLDKFGNIFVLDKFNRKIIRLVYNDVNESISYVTTLETPSITDPVHFCIEKNPINNINFNIWIADRFQSSIFKVTWSGATIGKYTYVTNSDNNSLYFNNPSKILIFNHMGIENIAIIDNNSKRLVIINSITGYQGNGIIGAYKVFNFSDDLNASLNSLGIPFPDGGLYVGDKNNKMFHIFEPNNFRYLGSISSVKKDDIVQPQWTSPLFLTSDAMSISDLYHLDFMTMDKWTSDKGINTYLPGADMVNPVVTYGNEPDNPWIKIDASLVGDPAGFTKILDQNSAIVVVPFNMIQHSSYHYSSIISGSILPSLVGKYYLEFLLSPRQREDYPEAFRPANYYTGVWFAMPLKSNLEGPKQGTTGSSLFWNVNPVSGSGDITCTWMKQDFGSSAIQTISTEKQLEFIMPNNSFTLICVVTDNFTKQTQTITQFISHITTSGSLTSDEE